MIKPRLPAITLGISGRVTALEGVWVGVTVVAVPPPEASGSGGEGDRRAWSPLLVVA